MKRLAPIIISVAVASGASLTAAQSPDPATLQMELQRSQALLYDLETEGDNLDPRLSEPLSQVADRLMRLGQYPEAHAALDRAMQVVRVNEGLYTPAQVPLLEQKLENYARWGNWAPARDQLQHMYWLYRTKMTVGEPLVTDFMELSAMHLRAVAGDTAEYQTYHLRRAESANRWALLVGAAIWGENDHRLAPMLYELAKQYHIQAAAIQGGGRVAYELRQVTPGANLMRDRLDARRYYYYSGLRAMKRIREIYASSETPAAEAVAMADLYLADWQGLFGRHEEALAGYQLAYQGLEEAGVDAATLAAYFSKPTLLPEPEFHADLSGALQARATSREPAPEFADGSSTGTLFFVEWSPAFPFVRPPFQLDHGQPLDSTMALFSFNLAGISDISRWLADRRKQAFSSVQEARLVQPRLDSPDQEELLMKRLESLRFRPRLEGGVPSDAAGTLMYQLAGELPR